MDAGGGWALGHFGGGVSGCPLDVAAAVTTAAATAPAEAEGATRWFRPNTDDMILFVFFSTLPCPIQTFFRKSPHVG